MSGGGTSVITYPVFLSLGSRSPRQRDRFHRGGFWSCPLSYNYLKGRTIDWTSSQIFSLIGLNRCIPCGHSRDHRQSRVLEFCVGILILALVAYNVFSTRSGAHRAPTYSKGRQCLRIFCIARDFMSRFCSGNGIAVSTADVLYQGIRSHRRSRPLLCDIVLVDAFCRHSFYSKKGISIWHPVRQALAQWPVHTLAHGTRAKGQQVHQVLFVGIGGILGLKLVLGLIFSSILGFFGCGGR